MGQSSRGYSALKVYQLAYKLAMDVFHASRKFPADERYSLTDQMRRSSRSVVANIAEGYRKRRHTGVFVKNLMTADGEATETQVWLEFAHDCGYLAGETFERLKMQYEEVGRMLGSMIDSPDKLAPFR